MVAQMNEHVYCIWCGSKGGFVNHLMIVGTGDNAIVECEWCSMKIVLQSTKGESK